MILWLYLHFPALLLDTLIRDNKVEAPLIVLSRTTGTVYQVNAQAREYGIVTGNDLGTASALCHGLDVADYDEQAESDRLRQLASLLYQVNADIVPYAPDGLLMKVTPMLKLYGSLDNYWQSLMSVLSGEQVQYHFALSPYPEAARWLSRAKADCGYLTPEATEQALAALSVRELGFTDKHVVQLERMGIRHAKQLLALPVDSLGQRFGKPLTAHLRSLTQKSLALPASFTPPEHFYQSLELLHEIANSQTLCFPLQRMLKEMAKFLHVREAVTPAIIIVLTQRDQEDKVLEITAAAPESAASRWMPLLQLHLEKLKLDAPVTHLRLEANTLLPRQSPTQDLFAGKRGQLTPGELISLMQAKAGKHGVYSLSLENDHRPEHAFKRQLPLQKSAQVLPPFLPTRPALLHVSPRPLLSRPDTLTGPERVSGGWWDKSPIQRDYFVARNKRGQLCWVFRTAQGEWFEHGLFC
ncbi:DNA polymerase IV [Grimontia celer]|uniref:DNA polymerase IV n=1 Tax=Grimontia celer TaxID=1796497 RepID=A0A128F394_9GAMM|nr:DNA polymerase Y family protein [Grimontia celer]CZF81015.1 DNA polymerase IV [Grimontia celer]